jgi:hypothetical protein
MEDSAKAFVQRTLELVQHPDSAEEMNLWRSGRMVWVNNGKLKRGEEHAKIVGDEARAHKPAPQVTVNSTDVDVLAPNAAAVTITFTGGYGAEGPPAG